jgi:hypothetical protein
VAEGSHGDLLVGCPPYRAAVTREEAEDRVGSDREPAEVTS